jgi:hypothetical protein
LEVCRDFLPGIEAVAGGAFRVGGVGDWFTHRFPRTIRAPLEASGPIVIPQERTSKDGISRHEARAVLCPLTKILSVLDCV